MTDLTAAELEVLGRAWFAARRSELTAELAAEAEAIKLPSAEEILSATNAPLGEPER